MRIYEVVRASKNAENRRNAGSRKAFAFYAFYEARKTAWLGTGCGVGLKERREHTENADGRKAFAYYAFCEARKTAWLRAGCGVGLKERREQKECRQPKGLCVLCVL